MKTYKGIEKPARFFGITFLDWIIIFSLVGSYLFIDYILSMFNVSTGLLGFVLLVVCVAYTYYKLRDSNKNKAPNYLLSYFSYEYLQVKKIDAKCLLLKKSYVPSRKARDLEANQEKKF